MRLLSVFLFLIIGALNSYALEWREIIKNFGETVCLIEISDSDQLISSGSGFVFGDEKHILTNAHVIKPAWFNKSLTVSVRFELSGQKNRKYAARVVKYSSDLDLAVLSTEETFKQSAELGDSKNLLLMDEILVIGYPLGKSIKATPGYLQAFQHIEGIGEMIDMSAGVDPGNSGGPVFGKDGKVIGIVTAKIPGYNFNLALPINLAKGFIDSEAANEKITVQTDPEGARIYIDGKYKGKSPVEFMFYGSRVNVVAELDDYETTETSIDSQPESKIVRMELQPAEFPVCALTITSTPAGAIVLIDNNEVGKTPLTIDVDQNSKVRIRLIKSRYREYREEIYIENENEKKLNLVLKK
jgi:hypothetical protein